MSTAGDEEEQEPQRSMLDVVCGLLLRDKPLLSRIVLAGRRARKEEPVKVLFEDLTNSQKHSYEGIVAFTGIFVETPSNFLQLLEGEPKNVTRLLSNLRASFLAARADDVQVLNYGDDIVERTWPKCAFVDVGAAGRSINHTEDTAVKEICDIQQKLLDLGGQVFTKEKLQIDTYLTGVKNKNPDMLPNGGQIDSLLAAGLCLSLEEFLQLYAAPVDIKLQGELVWPIPPPLKY